MLRKWVYEKIKRLLLLAWLVPGSLHAQLGPTLTLEQAQELAQQNYPVTGQLDLFRQTEQYTLDILNKGYFPQLAINGQASYQSDVTQVPLELPNMKIPSPPKDQYRITAEVNQLVYDGGAIRQQKKVEQLNTALETQQVAVELHKLRERINQLYLGALLLAQQLEQVILVQQDLETGIRKVEAQVKNGVSFRSNVYLLQAELLRNNQRRTELQTSRMATLQALALFLGQPLREDVKLAVPAGTELAGKTEIQRPELKLYSMQRTLLEQQNKLLLTRHLPKTSLFGQSGYGKPGLNFLLNEADWWYLAGIRFNWVIGNFYTYRNNKRINDVKQQLIVAQRETFLLNTKAQLTQQQAEVDKLQQLVETDREIVVLREKVKTAANAQLENGVITASDFLREVYALDQARQALNLHQLQLLQAKITYKTILGDQ